MRFSEILSHFDNTSVTASYKGRRFENIMASWFRTDPAFSTQVKKVWTWSEFHGRKDSGQSRHDVGIDLVVKTFSGEFWAVQCKCYQKDSSVTLPMVSNFIAAGITQFFDDEERTRPCNFSRLIFVNTGRMTATSKEAFSGKLIMACGTGKTYTSLKVAEDLLGGSGLVLFLVPSISLLGQSLNAWCADSEKQIKAVCVCSDSSASRKTGKNDDDDSGDTVADLALPASTNAKTILYNCKF